MLNNDTVSEALKEGEVVMGLLPKRRPSLAKRCVAHLRTIEAVIDLRQIGSIQELCQSVAAQRQRPISVLPFPLPRHIDGVCFATDDLDLIFVANDALPSAQTHTIVHELMHLWLGHTGVDHLDDLQRIFKYIDLPQAFKVALCRSRYDSPQEQETELLATMLTERWHARHPQGVSEVPSVLSEPERHMLQRHIDLAALWVEE